MLLWFARLPENYRLHVISEQTNLARQHRGEKKTTPVSDFYYDMLLRAIWKTYRTEKAIGRKLAVGSDALAEIEKIAIAKIKNK